MGKLKQMMDKMTGKSPEEHLDDVARESDSDFLRQVNHDEPVPAAGTDGKDEGGGAKPVY